MRRNFCFESCTSFRFASCLLRPSLYPTTPPPSSSHIFRKTYFLSLVSLFSLCLRTYLSRSSKRRRVMWTYQMWQLMGEDTMSWAARAGGQNNLPSISRLSHEPHELSVDLLSSVRRPGSPGRRPHLWTLVPHMETPLRLQLWAGACKDGPVGGLSEGLGLFSFCPHVSGVPWLRMCWATLHRSPWLEALLQAADAADGEAGGTQPQRLMRGTPSAARSCGTSLQHHHFLSHVLQQQVKMIWNR